MANGIGSHMAEYGEWNRKGAALSDVTAQKEYGVTRALGIPERAEVLGMRGRTEAPRSQPVKNKQTPTKPNGHAD